MTISAEKMKEMLWTMVLSRRFEDELMDLCKIQGKIPGMMILATGQEAVGSGACAALEPEDVIITNHRSHNHLLAKGANPNVLMAEIFCKRTGCNKGKSGTLHMAVPEINAPCTSTVVGAGPPIAVGRAFAQQYKGEKRVTVCFFGDGAAAEGSVHEAMNLAGLWRLPVIFICENNVYAGAQRLEEHAPVLNLADRAAGYAMPGVIVDGNDAPAVYQAVVEAKQRALSGDGPTFIECKTYRCRGHGEADPQHYQPKDEISAWQEKCPVPRLRDTLQAQGVITAADFQDMENRAAAMVREAVRFAEDSPYPSPEEALEDVFAE
ncbi:MAG TPA: thiamine pyrophosphate-dependent dehydrogenase E1 component subunit alpha [Desulfonatronum sp.]|nr:thiamine pyrophosphate-dependent dehydrogenase E1 component subunit alpha [Desulfonatronum sp.]